jgi:hypothetical protein
MGSGKGKTRRVQATTAGAAVKEVVLVEKKWTSFLEDNHIGRIKVYKYYFDNIPQQPAASDYEAAITELFADAVAVGAITLPSPYSTESFQFKIAADPNAGRYYQPMTVSLAARPSSEQKMGNVYRYLKSTTPMEGWNVTWVLRQLHRELNRLIANEH